MRLTINLKLGLAFAGIVLIAAAAMLSVISRLAAVNTAMAEVLHGPAQRAEMEQHLDAELRELVRAENNLLLAGTPQDADKFDAEI
jgi:methyl-accepting chemotaxis protein